MKNFAMILQILQLIPAVIAAVAAIEQAIPVAGAGADKKAAVLEMILSIAGVSAELAPQIGAMIDLFVGLANKTGAFPKGTK